ncbi:MAG: phosphatidate cytidylyltransferase [Gammaproteobacteria bacterium]
MLKRRLVTGAVFILLAVWAILGLPSFYFGLALALLVAIGAWEWAGLIGFNTALQRAFYTVLLLFCLWAASYLPVMAVLAAACVGWLIGLVWVVRFPAGRSLWTPSLSGALVGLFVLIPPWVALLTLHDGDSRGPYFVLFLLAMIWLADTAAYFAGRRWGSLRLAPNVSPGKTWEGLWGAVLAVALYALISGVMAFTGATILMFVVLCLVTLLFSILGDLLESMFKRQAGVKDSGKLLPGHGGILDRIDSLTAAAPVFVLSLLLSGMLK